MLVNKPVSNLSSGIKALTVIFLLTLRADHLRATSFAERLRLGLAVIHGEQKEPESERLDGRQSPPPALAESRRFASVSIDSMDLPGVNHFFPFLSKYSFLFDINRLST